MKKRFWQISMIVAFGLVGLGHLARDRGLGENRNVTSPPIQTQRTAAISGSRSPANTNPTANSTTATSTLLQATQVTGANIQAFITEIEKTAECYQSGDCPLNQEDPRAYDHAVGQKLTALLKEAHSKFKDDPDARPFLKKLGLDHFLNENGFVQEAALQILQDFPADEEILRAYKQGLQGSYNPLIVEMSLPALQKFIGTGLETEVHSILTDLLQGPHFASQTVAKNMPQFLNPNSYGTYASLLSGMKPETRVYKQLQSALKEYERRRTGG